MGHTRNASGTSMKPFSDKYVHPGTFKTTIWGCNCLVNVKQTCIRFGDWCMKKCNGVLPELKNMKMEMGGKVSSAGVSGTQSRHPGNGSRSSHFKTLVRPCVMSAQAEIVDFCMSKLSGLVIDVWFSISALSPLLPLGGVPVCWRVVRVWSQSLALL